MNANVWWLHFFPFLFSLVPSQWDVLPFDQSGYFLLWKYLP